MLRSITDSVLSHSARSGRGIVLNLHNNAVSHAARGGAHSIYNFQGHQWRELNVHAMSSQSAASPFRNGLFFLSNSRSYANNSTTMNPKLLPYIATARVCQPSTRGAVWSSNVLARGNRFFSGRNNRYLQQQQKQQQPQKSNPLRSLQRVARNFSVDSSNKVVYTIVAINVGVFLTWQYAEANARQFRDPRLFNFMLRNFTDSAQNLREGRIWTVVTSAFSHKEWYHILLNTLVLLSFGDPVWRMLGTARFLSVYLGSGVAASLSSVGYYSYLEPYLRKMQNKPRSYGAHFSMGASGSIMGITTAFACVYPYSTFSLFFVINMPAAALIGLFGAYELYNVLAVNTGRFDSAGHLGGGLFGAGYYFFKFRPLLRRLGRR